MKGILSNNNRLGGRIGIYEMPEYTAVEIDEPIDWVFLENLMRKHMLEGIRASRGIKLFVSDVDGTLTDGGMYYSEAGDEQKKFNTRDGMGFQLLRESGIKTGIITSENTKIVANRAAKLKIDYLCQGSMAEGKLECVKKICSDLNIGLEEVAYIGDDVNCYNLLSAVGLKACPKDACEIIKSIPGIQVMTKNGGEGCVREFISMILKPEIV